ncbi:hypothetical protein Cgig2_001617 [Carnegiea gigantea]|uniref:Uncharacterized protein n=1 Tax=Carnegiea gigantea TaxID=171969 RepID=A0A9Q1GS69_9CARY|nr:hypothetical protein Cgig2_001617 [Carnegiea gigantea]
MAEEAARDLLLPKIPQIVLCAMLLNDAVRLGMLRRWMIDIMESTLKELRWSTFEEWVQRSRDNILQAYRPEIDSDQEGSGSGDPSSLPTAVYSSSFNNKMLIFLHDFTIEYVFLLAGLGLRAGLWGNGSSGRSVSRVVGLLALQAMWQDHQPLLGLKMWRFGIWVELPGPEAPSWGPRGQRLASRPSFHTVNPFRKLQG